MLEERTMGILKPKPKLDNKMDWKVSTHTKHVIKYFAEYTRYSEDEVVDKVLGHLINDDGFLEWIHTQRRNTRMMKQLFPEKITENESDEQV
jgi:hypothetical protein